MKNFALTLSLATTLTSHVFATEDMPIQANVGVSDKRKSLDSFDLFAPENIQKVGCLSEKCNSLTKLDLYNFNTNNVQMMCHTFEECTPWMKMKILSPLITEEKVKTMFGNVSDSDTLRIKTSIKVEEGLIASFVCKFEMCCFKAICEVEGTAPAPLTDMSCLYRENISILKADFNKIDTPYFTKYVIDMHDMFFMCKRIKKIDLSKVDTRSVTNMDNMFRGCINLKEINVSGFDTSNVKSMKGMFAYCRSLKQLDISNFNMSNVKSCAYMFYNCVDLDGLLLPVAEKHVSHINKNAYIGCETLTRIMYK